MYRISVIDSNFIFTALNEIHAFNTVIILCDILQIPFYKIVVSPIFNSGGKQ